MLSFDCHLLKTALSAFILIYAVSLSPIDHAVEVRVTCGKLSYAVTVNGVDGNAAAVFKIFEMFI